MDKGAWWATVHGVTKSQERLSAFIFDNSESKESTCSVRNPDSSLGWEDPLEKELTTHWRTAWRIPWTEDPGGI